MKHLVTVTQPNPAKANEFQELLCKGNQTFADVLEALGGSSPLATYVAEKCDIPVPNEEAAA